MSANGTTLFIYGTLKRGMRNHHLISDQTFLGEAITLPKYRLFHLGAFPGLVAVSRDGVGVVGELWRIDPARLAQLDEFEGVPHLFDRRIVEIPAVIGPIEAYFYAGQPRDLPDCGKHWTDHKPNTSAIE